MASKLPRYGFTYFLVEDSNGEVYLGLSKPGITLSKKSSVQIPVKSKSITKSKHTLYRFEDIVSWKSESSTVELSIKTESGGKVNNKEIILFAKSVLQSTTIVDLINGYYKLRNMYNNNNNNNNNNSNNSSPTTLNKIKPKLKENVENISPTSNTPISVESKISSNSPSSPSPADKFDLSYENKNNVQAYFDEEFDDDDDDEEEEDSIQNTDEKVNNIQ